MSLEIASLQPLLVRMGWTLLHFVWQGAIAACLLQILLLAMKNRSANARYLMGCFCLLVLVSLPAGTFLLIPVSPSRDETAPLVANPALDRPMETASLVTDNALEEPDHSMFLAGESSATSIATTPVTFSVWLPSMMAPWLPWITGLWFAGVLALSLRNLVGWYLVQRLKRRVVKPVANQLQRLCVDLAGRVGISRVVRLLESGLIKVPLTIGCLRPLILLPAGVLTGLSPMQLEAILAHELAHIRRYDYLVNLFQVMVETLLFYHPAVWWVSKRIRVEREHCCDDIAVVVCGDAGVYAAALVEIEEMRGVSAFAMAAGGGSLLERIRRITQGPSVEVGRQFSGWLPLSAIILLFVFSLKFDIASYGDNDEESQPSQDKVLLFPENRSVGMVQVRSVTPTDSDSWVDYREAAGSVLIPLREHIRLRIYHDALRDPSFLTALKPTDLESLDASFREANDEFLERIKGLTSLRELGLSGSSITDAGLHNLGELHDLRKLQLASTPITGRGLAQIQNHKALQELVLNYTDTGDEGLKNLSSLPSLTALYLFNAGITNAGLAHLRNMTTLRELHLLQNNSIGDEGMQHLEALTSLEKLTLDTTSVGDNGLSYLVGLTSLKELRLNGTKVTDKGLQHLANLKHLEYLAIPPETTDAGLSHLRGLTSLRTLALQNTHASGKSLTYITGLTGLRNLQLPQVTDNELVSIRNFPSLEALWIQHSPITDKGLENIRSLKHLKELMLNSILASDEGYRVLKELPSLEMLYLEDTQKPGEYKKGIGNEGLVHLEGLTTLKHLSLAGSRVTNEGLAHIERLAQLRHLDLGKTRINDEGCAHLHNLRVLEYINLSHTQVTASGLARLLNSVSTIKGVDIQYTGVSPQDLSLLRSKWPNVRFTVSDSIGIDSERSLRIGDVAPLFSVGTIDGKQLDITSYRGKVVLLYFWSTWCGPCVDSMPKLKSLNQEFRGNEKFALISLSLDPVPHAVREIVQSFGLDWPQCFLGPWSDSSVRTSYGVTAIPQVFLIGEDGRILDTNPADLRAAVLKALEENGK